MSHMVNHTALFSRQAFPASGTAYTGSWVDVSSGQAFPLSNMLGFWFRMQSAGSPSIALSLDYSPFKSSKAVPSANTAFLSTEAAGIRRYDPDNNYLNAVINAAFTTVWDGSATAGGWTEFVMPADIKIPICSIRYNIVVSTANLTYADFIMTRVLG